MSLELSGLVGGLVATVAMTAFMMAMGDDSPPLPARLWAKYVGDGPPTEYMMQGMVLHFLYGIGAGWVFGLIAAGGLLALGMTPDRGMAVGFTLMHLVYGIVLGAFLGFGILV